MEFGPEDACGGPVIALLFTSACVHSRLEFVELVGVCALIAKGKFKPEMEVRAGTSSYHALYKYGNIGHAEVPEEYLYNT